MNKSEKQATAYLVGVLYGDGNMYFNIQRKNFHNYPAYKVKLCVCDKDFANEFERNMNLLGFPCGHNTQKARNEYQKNQYEIVNQTEKAYKFFKAHKNMNHIKKYDFEELRMFLKGFFDSEGSIQKGGMGKNPLQITMSQLRISPATPIIHFVLKKLGIKYSYHAYLRIRRRRQYEGEFRIYGNEIIRFHDMLGGFTIQRKEQTYQKILTNRKKYGWQDEEIDFLKKNYGRLTNSKIGKILHRGQSSINHKAWRLRLDKYVMRKQAKGITLMNVKCEKCRKIIGKSTDKIVLGEIYCKDCAF